MEPRNLSIREAETILEKWVSDNDDVIFWFEVGEALISQFSGKLMLLRPGWFVHRAGAATHCLLTAEYDHALFAEEEEMQIVVFRNPKDPDLLIHMATFLRLKSGVFDWKKLPVLSELIQ